MNKEAHEHQNDSKNRTNANNHTPSLQISLRHKSVKSQKSKQTKSHECREQHTCWIIETCYRCYKIAFTYRECKQQDVIQRHFSSRCFTTHQSNHNDQGNHKSNDIKCYRLSDKISYWGGLVTNSNEYSGNDHLDKQNAKYFSDEGLSVVISFQIFEVI